MDIEKTDRQKFAPLPETGPCNSGQAWTCTVQCEPGTRAPIERLFGAAGVEACVVARCSCEPRLTPTNEDLLDPTLPVAFVIFGVKYLLSGGR